MSVAGKTAIYAGSFDPITLGHLDLIKRAIRLFDHLIVAVGDNPLKKYMFSAGDRVDMVRDSIIQWDRTINNVSVIYFGLELLANYAAEQEGVVTLIRGLRTGSDLEDELATVFTNRRINDKVDTIFLTPKEEFGFISSSVVRQLINLRADDRTLEKFMPTAVFDYLED